VRTKDATIPSAYGTYPVTNTNELLGTPGVIGVKTGTTDEAGQNLILAVAENNHRLIIVVLSSTDRYADAQALLAYTRATWSWVALGDPKGLPGLGRALNAWGVTTHENKMIVLDSRLAPLIHYTLLLSPAGATTTSAATATASPGPAGTRGVIIFSIGDGELARLDVYAASAPTPG
jgi:D-alanyl-D-alanine carboxypeptidase